MLPWLSWNRNFRLLAIAVFGSGIFFGVQFSLFHNFIVEGIGIEAHELGYMEALREVPGFLNALFIAATILLSPPLLGGISLIVMGLGLALYAQADSFSAVLIYSFIWSIGFHAWLPLQGTMSIFYSEGEEKGKWIGRLRSVQSLSMLAAIVFVQICCGCVRIWRIVSNWWCRSCHRWRCVDVCLASVTDRTRTSLCAEKTLLALLSAILSTRLPQANLYHLRGFRPCESVRHRSGCHYHAHPNQSTRCVSLFAVDGLACGQNRRAHCVERELHRFNFYIRWLRVAEKSASFICSLLPR